MAESRSGGRRPLGDSELGSRSDATRRNGRRDYRRAHRHPWLRRGSIVAAAGLASLLILGVMGYLKLNGNITRLDITKNLGKRPSNSASADSVTNLKPLNILVMGSDSRDLGTTEFGTTPGGGSDTTLLLHLSGDRKSAVVVSIPRDSMTRAPRDCKDPNSTVAGGPLRIWNANFNAGGPACVIRTLEGNTGIFVDHFMVVDFLGFQSMVEALGSVEVCVPTAVDDPKSHLKLPAGRSRVSGDQALAFVRVRKNIGVDGSDLGRINRQQAFLAAMVQEATSSKLLLRPDKLFRFLVAATSSLTLDKDLGTNAMREVAQSAVGLKTSQVKFVTVPNEPWSQDHNRVQWTSAADALWKSIRDDAPLPGSGPPAGSRPRPAATDAPALTVRPDQITVRISNASGVNGLARRAAEDLRLQGFGVSALSTDTDLLRQGVAVSHPSRYLEQARTVAAAFPGARLVVDEAAGSEIRVTLGNDSAQVVEVPNRVGTTPLPTRGAAGASTPSPAVTIKARSADSNICAP